MDILATAQVIQKIVVSASVVNQIAVTAVIKDVAFSVSGIPSTCPALLAALTTAQLNECILPDYDFSDTEVTDNLTAQQLTDLGGVVVVPIGETEILALSPLLWLKPDASRVTKDGTDRLSQVDDISGNANHATQTAASQKALWVDGVLNGRPVIRFDDTDINFDLTTPLSPAGDYSVFAILKPNALIDKNVSAKILLRKNVTTTPRWAWSFGIVTINLTDETLSTFVARTDGQTASHAITDNISAAWHIFETTLDGNMGIFRIDRDIKNQISPSIGNFTLDSSDGERRMVNVDQIGDEPTQSLDGDLAELIIFDTSLSPEDNANVYKYINNEYAL